MSQESTPSCILGVDTHADRHVGAVVDTLGRPLGVLSVPTSKSGYRRLLAWARSFGKVEQAGVEGTGSYGSGLMRFLLTQGVEVKEVNRPDRSRRRRLGKNDPTDAENAARAVLSGEASGSPKAKNGLVESIRVFRVARRSAIKARTQAGLQLRDLIVTSPDALRQELQQLPLEHRVRRCARFRTSRDLRPEQTVKRALRSLARRWLALADEIAALDKELEALTEIAAPRLLSRFGIGTHTAATLLVTAGDNPQRLRSEASFAALCGVSPIEASSGKVLRHRLNRGGDRSANSALWMVAIVRLRSDPQTQRYAARRTEEGKSKKEILRCLKRYIARQIYPTLLSDLNAANARLLT